MDFDVAAFSKAALATVMATIKKCNELPFDGDDYDYYASFKGFRNAVNVESKRMRSLMERILLQQGSKVNLANLELDEMFDVLVDANDIILERVSTAVDEACGFRKKVDPVLFTTVHQKRLDVNTSWNRKGGSFGTHSANNSAVTYTLLTGRNVQRPQLKFKDRIDNSHSPFVPIIKEKPHSLKPLAIILEPTDYGEMFSHPYQCELDHFKVGVDHLNETVAQKAKSLQETPFHFVNNVDKLRDLNEALKLQTEFAVDLEHHSYRTFQGITCLMQISTRDTDYIIDTLELRNELQLLNESFTDPKIVKVFHGADKDVEWLQRDFGIYVVNLFDTGQASRVLSLSSFSLAFLLKQYCDVDADKQYQLADWRIRPLPETMVHYAREDTHYLLYIYDCLKNQLLENGNDEKNLLLSVFQRSKILCEKRYVKPLFHSEVYLDLYKKSRKVFNARQLYALRELYKWRDNTARAEDESTGYVLPNHQLLQIAEILPREHQGVLACCNPIPTLVRQNINDIHLIILRAREQSLIKTVEQDLQIELDSRRHQVDLDNVLHCPHDLRQFRDSGSCDNEDGTPTILEMWSRHGDDFNLNKIETKQLSLKDVPQLSALISISSKRKPKRNSKLDTTFKSYCSPFQRYALVCSTLNKVESEWMAVPIDKVKEVNSVRQHFTELVKIYGDTTEKLSDDVAGSSLPKSSKRDSEQLDNDNDNDNDDKEMNEPIRKKVDRKEKLKMSKSCRKNRKRKRKAVDDVGAVDQAAPLKTVKSEQPLTTISTSIEPKDYQGTTSTLITVTNDDQKTSFRPFDYSQANFEQFKGGSTNKNEDEFNPNRNRKMRGGRFNQRNKNNNKSGRSSNSNYNCSGKSNKSWPKL